MPTTVKLLSFTSHPVETIYCLWEASRQPKPFPLDPAALADFIQTYAFATVRSDTFAATRLYFQGKGRAAREVATDEALFRVLTAEIQEVFAGVVHGNIPVAENINLVFLLEGVPVSLREQMVRHRIGHHFGDRLGCDIVPDLGDSTWWSQTMRVIDMSNFAEHEMYFIPESVVAAGPGPALRYHSHMRECQSAYRDLLRAGIPEEDARNVIPIGATHSISWGMNLSALRHIIGKRGCWIAQLGIWEPVIRGMIEEVAAKIHPLLRSLIDPPCIQRGRWVGCSIGPDNLGRIRGRDAKGAPPCSLYLAKHEQEAVEAVQEDPGIPNRAWQWKGDRWEPPTEQAAKTMAEMQRKFGVLWQRNPETGEPVF